jgi:hypothetical protein
MSLLTYRLEELRARIRRRFVFYGTGRLVIALCAIAAASFACDYLFHLPRGVRGVILVGTIAGLAYVAYRHLLYPLSVKISDDDLAITYENAYPGSANILISAIQLRRDMDREDYPYSKNMSEAVIRHADHFAESLDPERLATTPIVLRHLSTALALVVVLGALASIFPSHAGLWVSRFFLSSAEWPRATTLVVKYPATVVRGDDALIQILGQGVVPSRVRLSYELKSGARGSVKIDPHADKPNQFSYSFKPVLEPLKFRLSGGDHETGDFEIQVRIPPRLHEVQISYRWPAYTRLAPGPRTPGGHVDALQGTVVEFFGTSNEPLTEAALEFEGGDRVALQVQDRQMNGRFTVKERTRYSVHMLSRNGLANAEKHTFSVEPRMDRPPTVDLKKPGRDMKVLFDSTIPLSASAEDDYGLAAAAILHQITRAAESAREPERKIDIPVTGWPKSATLKAELALSSLGLKEGDELLYSLEARDANDVTGPGVGRSNSYKFTVVSRAELEDDVDRLGAEVREDIDTLIELQDRILSDTEDLMAAIRPKGNFEETDLRRLSAISLYQEQVTMMAETALLKVVHMVESIEMFKLSHLQIVGALKSVAGLLDGVRSTRSPQATQHLKGAAGPQPVDRLRVAANKETESLKDLLEARDLMRQFADLAGVIRDVKGVLQKESELKHEVIEEIKKKRK